MASILKVDTIQDQDGNNIINESANTITIGASGDTITIPSGATFASVGIDDNATSTAITIDSSQNVDVAGLLTSDGLTMNTGANSTYTLEFGANRTSDSQALGIIRGSWDGTVVSQINLSAGDDTTNKDNGQIFFRTAEAGTTANRLQIAENGDISFYEDTGTTPKFYWDASTERLGIGTSSPSVELDVRATSFTPYNTNTTLITEAPAVFSQAQHFYIYNAGAYNNSRPTGGIGAINASSLISLSAGSICTDNPGADGFRATATSSSLYDIGSGNHEFKTKTGLTVGDQFTHTTRMIIKDSGSVGIGTTNPFVASGFKSLELNNTGGDAIELITGTGVIAQTIASNTNSLVYMGSRSNNSLVITTNDTERMRIDSTGSVGIGTTSPFNSRAGSFTVSNTAPTIYLEDTDSGGSGVGQILYTGGDLAYSTGNRNGTGTSGSSEHFRITNAGNVGIGTSSPDCKLRVDDSANQSILAGVNSNSSFSSNGVFLQLSRNTTNNSFYAIGYYNAGAGNYKFRVADSGNVTNTNNSYGSISDEKLKENIVDATPKLEKLKQVRIVNFNFIDDNQKQIGVIAQELENIFPSMVEESPDKDEDGKDLNTTTKQVKYSVFVPILIKALQEQQTQIEELKAEITALKNQP